MVIEDIRSKKEIDDLYKVFESDNSCLKHQTRALKAPLRSLEFEVSTRGLSEANAGDGGNFSNLSLIEYVRTARKKSDILSYLYIH